MIILGDNLLVMPTLPEKYFHTCVTSPPYWGLRDYGIPASEWPEITFSPMSGLPTVTVPVWTGCLGLEPTPEMFVAHTVHVFREVWRVLRDDGTLWVNYGDSYAGSNKGRWGDGNGVIGEKPMQSMARVYGNIHYGAFDSGLKPKDLIGIPWRVAFALQADGWYLRMDNIWAKPNPMPESVQDRPTKAHEYFFLLSKSKRYYFDFESIKEPMAASSVSRLAQDVDNQKGSNRANGGAKSNGTMKAVGGLRAKGNARTFRGGGKYTGGQSFDNNSVIDRESRGNVPNDSGLRNKRSIWTVATAQCKEAHFATFPERLVEPCILAGAPEGGNILDPFGGSGTVGKVAKTHNRNAVLIEIGPKYVDFAKRRVDGM